MLSSSRVLNYSRDWQNMHITIRCPPTQCSKKATKDKLIATKHNHLHQLPKLSRIFDLNINFFGAVTSPARLKSPSLASALYIYIYDGFAYIPHLQGKWGVMSFDSFSCCILSLIILYINMRTHINLTHAHAHYKINKISTIKDWCRGESIYLFPSSQETLGHNIITIVKYIFNS